MYYLLEDNRIIDSNNLPYEWKFFSTLISEKDKTIILHCRDPRERKQFKIKKQSEKVFDLIDWNNDLVRINTTCGSMIVDCKHAKSDFSDGYYNVEWINAIYKFNDTGNYIKVWEKKEWR